MDILPFDEPTTWDADTLSVAPVGRAEVIAFLARWHYTKGGGANTFNVGLYHGLRLVGVAAFGYPISMDAAASVFGPDDAEHVMDLGRFALVDEAPHNTESWFLVRALQTLKTRRPHIWAVTAFADPTEGHQGTIYQATNAIYAGCGAGSRTQYLDARGVLHSDRCNGHRVGLDEARQRGWSPVRRAAKHRYLLLMPDNKTHRRMLQKRLRWTSQPYPGRELVTA